MGRVNTVLGPIATEELGITAMHEHISFGQPSWDLDDRWWTPPHRVFEAAEEKLGHFARLGGRTLVELTAIGFGRDIARFQTISAATGVNIVACTGFWTGDGTPTYFRSKPIEYLTDLFIKEITDGIAGTTVKAGIIKVGVSRGGLTELDQRIYRAAARAAVATGVPVTTHLSTHAEQQLDLFEGEGLDPRRVVLGHADAGMDFDNRRDLMVATRGAYVGFDTIGYDTEKGTAEDPAPPWARPRRERLDQVLELIEAGHVDRTVVSADANCWSLGWTSPPHSVAELLEYFVPDLQRENVTQEAIQQLLIANPADILTMVA